LCNGRGPAEETAEGYTFSRSIYLPAIEGMLAKELGSVSNESSWRGLSDEVLNYADRAVYSLNLPKPRRMHSPKAAQSMHAIHNAHGAGDLDGTLKIKLYFGYY
jgi:hypothetical protein